MSRPYKVHYVASHRTLCATPLQYNAHPDRTTPYRSEVTCLICLYHLGLYTPLVKLAEGTGAGNSRNCELRHACQPRYAPEYDP